MQAGPDAVGSPGWTGLMAEPYLWAGYCLAAMHIVANNKSHAVRRMMGYGVTDHNRIRCGVIEGAVRLGP
jgi:hypothetical protein